MNHASQNELLSAYLDGELSPEERAEVERLLGASAEARQLVEELRALSSSLKALPTLRVGEDISQEVLRRVERRMAIAPKKRPQEETRDVPKEEPAGHPPENAPHPPGWFVVLRRVARPRNLAWSALAVAVALLLMVTEWGRLGKRGDRSVAMKQTPQVEEPAAPPAGEPPAMRALREMPADMPAPMLADEEGRKGSLAFPFSSASEISDGTPLKGSQRPAIAGEKTPPAESSFGVKSELSAQPAPPAERLTFSTPSEPAQAPRPSKASGMAGGVAPGGGEKAAAGADQPGQPYGQPSLPHMAKGEAVTGSAVQEPMKPKLAEVALEPVTVQRLQRGRSGVGEPLSQPAPEPLLVVWCDVAAEGPGAAVFFEVLGQENLTQAGAPLALRGADAPAVLRELGVVSGKPEPEQLQPQSMASQPAGTLSLDLDATPEQIKALLARIEAQPKQFLAVSYTSPAGWGYCDYSIDQRTAGTGVPEASMGRQVDEMEAMPGQAAAKQAANGYAAGSSTHGGDRVADVGQLNQVTLTRSQVHQLLDGLQQGQHAGQSADRSGRDRRYDAMGLEWGQPDRAALKRTPAASADREAGRAAGKDQVPGVPGAAQQPSSLVLPPPQMPVMPGAAAQPGAATAESSQPAAPAGGGYGGLGAGMQPLYGAHPGKSVGPPSVPGGQPAAPAAPVTGQAQSEERRRQEPATEGTKSATQQAEAPVERAAEPTPEKRVQGRIEQDTGSGAAGQRRPARATQAGQEAVEMQAAEASAPALEVFSEPADKKAEPKPAEPRPPEPSARPAQPAPTDQYRHFGLPPRFEDGQPTYRVRFVLRMVPAQGGNVAAAADANEGPHAETAAKAAAAPPGDAMQAPAAEAAPPTAAPQAEP